MPDYPLLTTGLAFLMPIGFALIAAGGLPKERARAAAVSVLAALGLASLGYVLTGFALQFGGVGLAYSLPGLQELIWEWSLLGTTWGAGWGMAGLVGWAMTGPAATAGAYTLALVNLPWATTAALIPLVALRGRIPKLATALLGLLIGGVIYPLAGNWVWGGGWLANLGHNLGQGHGLVDPGGAGLVHLVGASATLAGIVTFTARRPRRSAEHEPIPLPTAHFPALALFGAVLLLAGSLAWTISNPLIRAGMLDPGQIALNSALAGAGGALLSLLYTWFVAGRPDPLMASRGLAGGVVAAAAAAPFIPPWAALVLGASLGLLTPLAIFTVDHLLRWDDATAALTVHGLGGALGLLAVGLLADGRTGIGWNGLGPDSYLGVARQGVTGLLAAPNLGPDWPAQMQAQVVGLAALALFTVFAAWLLLAPPTLLAHILDRMAANAGAAAQPREGIASEPDDADFMPVARELEPFEPVTWPDYMPDGENPFESEPRLAQFENPDGYVLPEGVDLPVEVAFAAESDAGVQDGDHKYHQET